MKVSADFPNRDRTESIEMGSLGMESPVHHLMAQGSYQGGADYLKAQETYKTTYDQPLEMALSID